MLPDIYRQKADFSAIFYFGKTKQREKHITKLPAAGAGLSVNGRE